MISFQQELDKLVAGELSLRRRYRCLILQSDRIDVLGRLCECLPSAFGAIGKAPILLSWEDFFDAVGAISSDEARGRITTAGNESPVVLAGPLHYVDYWTSGVQNAFWSFLSLYSKGPGVVVVDVPRSEAIEGPFLARGTIRGTEIRYLRPRLVATEDTIS